MSKTGSETIPSSIRIRNDLQPGDIGYITYLHGTLYAAEYGWDYTFEAYVAAPLGEFAKSHTEREGIWIVEKDEKPAGSIGIVAASTEQAQLRWFLLHPDLRGQGIGRRLLEQAINFCRDSGYLSIFLWTVSALMTAGKLYHALGFRVTEEHSHTLWGARVIEQRYELNL